MDNVILLDYHLQIQVACPHCNKPIVFLNYQIPEKTAIYRTCKKCKKPLRIKPFNVLVELKKDTVSVKSTKKSITKKPIVKPPTSSHNTNTILIKKAKRAVMSYGFKGKEIDSILKQVDIGNMNLERLIKTILAKMGKDEHTKT